MAEPYLGQISMFAGNFAPRGYALCDGQLLPISQNTALFSLIGTFYGGDGVTTFALPNLQGGVPVHQGQGVGLSAYDVGQTGGSTTVTLTIPQIPAHTHPIGASALAANTDSPSGATALAVASADAYLSASDVRPLGSQLAGGGPPHDDALGGPPPGLLPMGSQMVGGGLPHDNVQPCLGLSFIIALQGIFPSRN
ncbi:MAG: phage tail protein [Steroidobacteraceae bacterium]